MKFYIKIINLCDKTSVQIVLYMPAKKGKVGAFIRKEKVCEDRYVMLTFTITANGISEKELIKVAESMTCVSEADSNKYFG